ncbi:MAG: hypothetical protein ABJQ29_09945 [Luteolibacter sp.]
MNAFEELRDSRNGKAKLHYFGEDLFTALVAMVCGMEGSDDFERFAKLMNSGRAASSNSPWNSKR